MKVAIVGPYPDPGKPITGGVERVVDTLIGQLRSLADVSLIVPGATHDTDDVVSGVRVVRLRRFHGVGAAHFWAWTAKRIAEAVEYIEPDIVHYHAVAGFSRFVRRPGILTVHGIAHRDIMFSGSHSVIRKLMLPAYSIALKAIEHRYRNRIGNVIVINPFVEEVLPDITHLRRFNIPNPVDQLFITREVSQATRQRRLVSIGRISPLKNTLYAVRLVADVLRRDSTLRMTFFGAAYDSNYFEQCRRLAVELGVSSRIEFPGSISSSQCCEELDTASVLLMTSLHENAPVVIAEALARGVAVVAPKQFGIKYMIKEYVNGFFLPNDDFNGQSEVIARALDYSWDRVAIARTASLTYSPSAIASSTMHAYGAVISSSRLGH